MGASTSQITYGSTFISLLFLSYFTQGLRCFPWLAITYHFKDYLKVDPGTMQFLMASAGLPAIAKPIYGIISDSVYIRGAHRLPYLIIANLLQALGWGAIAMHRGVSSSVLALTAFLTVTNLGGAISEVMNDAMVVEAGKNKKGGQQGELQSIAWLAMASGAIVGNLTAGYAMKILTPEAMLTIFVALILVQVLLALFIDERSFGLTPPKQDTDESQDLKSIDGKQRGISAIRQQISILASLLRKPEIMRPMLWFLSSYAVIPILGSSVFYFQTQNLKLSASVIGLAKVVGQLGLLIGSTLYNKSLKGVPIRRLFAIVQTLLAVCMLSDIVLVKRWNLELGIPDKWFLLSTSAFVEAIAQFKNLPFVVLLAELCPRGSEGSLFSFFASAQCIAGLMSGYLGVALASYLHITTDDFSALPLGILIQALCTLLPVFAITFIARQPKKITDSPQQVPATSDLDTKKEL
ncbi:unnamed protein product [Sphagnum jensenii]|uniref:Uncharacterized protein n=1 Tax=Sphagnum jensenii TaxID=128206 RepID=A0ABP0XI62_9BRYO